MRSMHALSELYSFCLLNMFLEDGSTDMLYLLDYVLNVMLQVEGWWGVLLPKVAPLLYGNGGPIIMVQVRA